MVAPKTIPILATLALAGCAASVAAPVTTSATAPSADVAPLLTQERVTALIGEIARIRNLAQRAPIPVYLLDKPQFIAALRERIERKNVSREEIEKQKAFHVAFDLLPDDHCLSRSATPIHHRRGADDVMQAADVPARPKVENDESPTPPQSESAPIPSGPQSMRQTNSMEARWSFTDAMVFLFAAAVLVLSIVGFWWLLRN